MNYFALFLDDSSFVERCLFLLRFISNPSSRSLPHITVRLFKMPDSRIEELKHRTFTHLDIIEPGSFNMSEEKPPYVVFLQCESEELEGIEYKPDFPYSRLHITVYEGPDRKYAGGLYDLLAKENWHFRLPFAEPRFLREQRVGTKVKNRPDAEAIYTEILGEGYHEFLRRSDDDELRLQLTEKVLLKLRRYLDTRNTEQIESRYTDPQKFNRRSEGKGNVQYRFNFSSSGSDQYILEKPVRDAVYITPPEYARDMAVCGLQALGDDDMVIHFGDSAIGTGNLFLALKFRIDEVNAEEGKKFCIGSAIGIDIDAKMAAEAYARCNTRGLEVIQGDALFLEESDLGGKRNLMLVNPPFNRHEDIPKEYREALYQSAKQQTGIELSKNSGLYAYHLLIMDRWLCEGGVGVWLLPAVFMQTQYGAAVRRYLLDNVELLWLHVYDEHLEQFGDAMISTCIVAFRKKKAAENGVARLSYGESVERPERTYRVTRSDLLGHMDNWRVLFDKRDDEKKDEGKLTFGDLFEIKRGLATGANSFFVMTREQAKERCIPNFALRPILPKARYLDSQTVEEDEDGFPAVKPQLVLLDCDMEEDAIRKNYPDFYRYLQSAKKAEGNVGAIVDRTLVRGRKPWYKQEKREAAPFLMTYMGRNKKNLPPLYFIWNKTDAAALNTYILLYPKERLQAFLDGGPARYRTVLEALNRTAEAIISERTRIYAGGLKKIEPGELAGLSVGELERLLRDGSTFV